MPNLFHPVCRPLRGFAACLALVTGAAWGAQPGQSIPWMLDSQERPQVKVLLRQPLGTTENRRLIFIIDPVKYGKPPSEYSISVDAHCHANRRISKTSQVSAFPKMEGGRFVLPMPKHLAKCYKIDSTGQVAVGLTLKTREGAEPLVLKGSLSME
jgi:hypothetical protein